MPTESNLREKLWDEFIPAVVILPGQAGKKKAEAEDLVFKRVPGTKYAAYSVEYGRDKLFPPKNGSRKEVEIVPA